MPLTSHYRSQTIHFQAMISMKWHVTDFFYLNEPHESVMPIWWLHHVCCAAQAPANRSHFLSQVTDQTAMSMYTKPSNHRKQRDCYLINMALYTPFLSQSEHDVCLCLPDKGCIWAPYSIMSPTFWSKCKRIQLKWDRDFLLLSILCRGRQIGKSGGCNLKSMDTCDIGKLFLHVSSYLEYKESCTKV